MIILVYLFMNFKTFPKHGKIANTVIEFKGVNIV